MSAAIMSLSQETIGLLNKQSTVLSDASVESHETGYSLSKVLSYMKDDYGVVDKKERLLLEALRAHIIRDLQIFLANTTLQQNSSSAFDEMVKKVVGKTLTLVGAINAFLSGALAASVFLVIMPAMVIGVYAGLCVLCGLINVAVFYAFDRVQIANFLGEKEDGFSNAFYVLCVESEYLFLATEELVKKALSLHELDDDSKEILAVFSEREKALSEALSCYQESAQQRIAKKIASITTGVLYFSGGYFLAQAALQLLSKFVFSIALTGTAISSWPVVILGTLLGLSALALYSCCERPQLEMMVEKIFFFDREAASVAKKSLGNTKDKLDRMLNRPSAKGDGVDTAQSSATNGSFFAPWKGASTDENEVSTDENEGPALQTG